MHTSRTQQLPADAKLDGYCHSRLVVLGVRATASEAALALKMNDVGAVLVAVRARIVGIVTDRDLALRVVGERRDPCATVLGEIMSPRVSTLPPDATERSVLRVMKHARLRRVPLVEEGRAVGIVTLDDLVLAKAATLEELAGVVGAQLVNPGPARSRIFDEWRSLERRYARGLKTWTELAVRVEREGHLRAREHAEQAIEIVLCAIARRLEPALAKKLRARLPAVMHARLVALPAGPDESITRRGIEVEVARALSVSPSKATAIVEAVGAALARSVRVSDAVGRRLPPDLRSLFVPPPVEPARTPKQDRHQANVQGTS